MPLARTPRLQGPSQRGRLQPCLHRGAGRSCTALLPEKRMFAGALGVRCDAGAARWERLCIGGCKVGESGLCSRAASRGGGAPPTPPPRLGLQAWESQLVPFRGTFDHTLDAKNRLTVPARYRAALADGVVLAMPVDLKPCVGVWRPGEYDAYTRRALADVPPLSSRLSELERFFYGSSHDAELDTAGRIMVPNIAARVGQPVQGRRRRRRRRPPGAVGQGDLERTPIGAAQRRGGGDRACRRHCLR